MLSGHIFTKRCVFPNEYCAFPNRCDELGWPPLFRILQWNGLLYSLGTEWRILWRRFSASACLFRDDLKKRWLSRRLTKQGFSQQLNSVVATGRLQAGL
jgi:hypothetical protein